MPGDQLDHPEPEEVHNEHHRQPQESAKKYQKLVIISPLGRVRR